MFFLHLFIWTCDFFFLSQSVDVIVTLIDFQILNKSCKPGVNPFGHDIKFFLDIVGFNWLIICCRFFMRDSGL